MVLYADVFSELNDRGVGYVVVGDVAVVLHPAIVPVGDVPVRVASIAHLIAMKQAAGRPQDLADVEALRRIEARQP